MRAASKALELPRRLRLRRRVPVDQAAVRDVLQALAIGRLLAAGNGSRKGAR